jgi:hypothetical protein
VLSTTRSEALQVLGGQGSATTDTGRLIHSYRSVLDEIHRLAPNARIYIAGYPAFFGDFGTKANSTCNVGTAVPGSGALSYPVDLYVAYQDAVWINSQAASINSKLRRITTDAQADGIPVTFANVAKDFSQHGLCDKKSAWLNQVTVSVSDLETLMPDSFHPDASGQRAYESAFIKAGITSTR